MVADIMKYYEKKEGNVNGAFPFNAVVDCYRMAEKKELLKDAALSVKNKRPY
jgi:hypothetical protein